MNNKRGSLLKFYFQKYLLYWKLQLFPRMLLANESTYFRGIVKPMLVKTMKPL